MRRFGLVVILLVLWVTVAVPRLVGAAQATPDDPSGGSPVAAACDVEPVAIDAATPAPSSEDEAPLPEDGPTADPDTIADLQLTLDALLACAEAGDLERIAALFTPAGFAREVLAEEPVQIEPADGATPVASSELPLAAPLDPGLIDRAFVLEDGSVAAYVDVASSTPRLVLFVRGADGGWLIDAIVPLPREATPAAAVGAEEVPPEVWDAVVTTLGLTGDVAITVLELEAVDWPDASLGCPEEGGFYAQVVTPGYRIVVEVDGERTEVHTDLAGNAVTCEPSVQTFVSSVVS